MQTALWINSLHPENLSGNYNPLKSDYPVRLLTRRTLGYFSENILAARSNSPTRLSYNASPFTTPRPPC